MLWSLVLWAEEEAKKAADPGIWGFTPFLLIIVAFYFLLILPAQRRERRQRESINSSIKKDVEVVTSGGIIGKIAHIKDNGEEVTLKVDDNTKLRVLRASIVRILTPLENAPDAAASSDNKTTTAIKEAKK